MQLVRALALLAAATFLTACPSTVPSDDGGASDAGSDLPSDGGLLADAGSGDGDEDSGTAEPTDGGSAPDGGAVGGDGDGDGDNDAGTEEPTDGGSSPDAGGIGGDGDGDGDPTSVVDDICRELDGVDGPLPDYAQYEPVIPDACGTGHGLELGGFDRVVFLGDSVTVGTPPTLKDDYYRNRVAVGLAERFGLEAPNGVWAAANPFDGKAGARASGDFYSCSEWGANTKDLPGEGGQVEECFPPEERDLKTLVVMTMGGNDIKKIAQDGGNGAPVEDLWAYAELTIEKLREALLWMKDPGNVPGGVHIVFANVYEFTDGTADVESCPATGLDGFHNWEDPSTLIEIINYVNERYMDVAVETGSDLIFMFEAFCGHGFHNDDAESPCYIGPDAERWFDLTCIHPNPKGHAAIADMFLHVIDRQTAP